MYHLCLITGSDLANGIPMAGQGTNFMNNYYLYE